MRWPALTTLWRHCWNRLRKGKSRRPRRIAIEWSFSNYNAERFGLNSSNLLFDISRYATSSLTMVLQSLFDDVGVASGTVLCVLGRKHKPAIVRKWLDFSKLLEKAIRHKSSKQVRTSSVYEGEQQQKFRKTNNWGRAI